MEHLPSPEPSGRKRPLNSDRRHEADLLFAALATTWPPAETRVLPPWTLRRGAGGGNRASAATLDAGIADLKPAIAEAEAALRAWSQRPLFLIRPGEAALDATLARQGYVLRDRSLILTAPVAALAPTRPDPRAILGTAPLAIQRELWRAHGIGEARQAVCDRVAGPRAFLLGRLDDSVEAAAFVAVAGRIAMLHALTVAPPARRQGLGGALTRAAAAWAVAAGAETLALAVTEANGPARALYARLGMAEAAAYHYRAAPEDVATTAPDHAP